MLGALLLPAPASAAGTQAGAAPGAVVVYLRAPAAVPSVESRVVLVDEADATRRLETVVEVGTPAWLDDVAPGRYHVLLLAGGDTLATTWADVGAREIVVLDAALPGDPEGTARIGVGHRARVDDRTEFDERFLRDLPGALNLWGLVETAAPFVISSAFDTGGLATVQPPLLGSRGASWTLTTLSLGDVEIGYPTRLGLLPFVPDLAAVERVTVTAGLTSVDVGTPGVRLELTPRAPSTWQGVVQGSVTSPGMVATNRLAHAPSIARIEQWTHGGATVGGPIGAGAGLLVSAGVTRARFQERDDVARSTATAATLFAHGVAQAGGQRWRVVAGLQRARHPFPDRQQFLDPAVDLRARFGQWQVSWDSVDARGGRRVVTGGVQVDLTDPRVPSSARGGTVDRVLDGVVPNPARRRDAVAWNLGLGIDRPRVQWGSVTHLLRAGASVRRTSVEAVVVEPRPVAETVAGLPARLWVPMVSGSSSLRTVTDVAAFLSDHLVIGPDLSIAAGLRLDRVSGQARGAEAGITWTTLSPRASLRWSPTPLGVYASYGRYQAAPAVSLLSFGDPGEPWAEVYRWTDPDGNGLAEADEVGPLLMRAGRGQAVAAIDPDVRSPTLWEWAVGGEYRISPLMTLQGGIFLRTHRNLVGSINTGAPASAWRSFEIPDANADQFGPADDQLLTVYERLPASFGQDAYLLTNPAGAEATYEGIELTWRLRGSRWAMLFGATAYRTRGWGGDAGPRARENDQLVIGDRFEQPFGTSELLGSFFFDRSYVGKWSGSYRAPGDLRFGFIARYQDGQPFSRVVVLPDLSTGPQMVQAYRVGQTRYTYSATVDVRVEKGIRVGASRLAVVLDAFNLTNHRNEVEEDFLTGPTFRQSTAVQPPLTLRLGLRLDF